MNDNQITSLLEECNLALKTGDPKKVSSLYDDNSVLLPTLSNKVRHNKEEIEDYFTQFLAKGPKSRIDEENVRHFDNLAINSGAYTFTFKDGSSAQARFTFAYRWNGKRWLIVEHHSSLAPE